MSKEKLKVVALVARSPYTDGREIGTFFLSMCMYMAVGGWRALSSHTIIQKLYSTILHIFSLFCPVYMCRDSERWKRSRVITTNG